MVRPTAVMFFALCNIIFGAMTVLCAPVGLFSLIAQDANAPARLSSTPAGHVWELASYAVQVFIYLVMLVSGIGMLRLLGWSRNLAVGAGAALAVLGVLDCVVSLALWPRPDLSALGTGDSAALNSAARALGAFIGTIAGSGLRFLYGLLMALLLSRPAMVTAFEGSEEMTLPTV